MFDLEARRAKALVVLCSVLGMLVPLLYLKTLGVHCVLTVNQMVKLLFKFTNKLFLFIDVHLFSLDFDLLLDFPTFIMNIIEPIDLHLKFIQPINNLDIPDFVLICL